MTPTPEQLTRWPIEALKLWDKTSVSIINQSHHAALNEMCQLAGIDNIDFGCSGCTAQGLNRLVRMYKEYLK